MCLNPSGKFGLNCILLYSMLLIVNEVERVKLLYAHSYFVKSLLEYTFYKGILYIYIIINDLTNVNESLAWKYHGNIDTNSGNSSIQLPAKFEELSLEIYQHETNERKLKIHITKNEIKSYAQTFYTGAYYSTSNFCGAAIRVDNSGIYHYGMSVNGSQVVSVCEISYR